MKAIIIIMEMNPSPFQLPIIRRESLLGLLFIPDIKFAALKKTGREAPSKPVDKKCPGNESASALGAVMVI